MNHITYSVENLHKSIEFYRDVLKANLLVEGEKTAYFKLAGVWLALNEETNIPRDEIEYSYTHIAFTISDNEFDCWYS
ncbi:VOC family protein, partial [Staphylococcus gallinarum]|uniref:VOC family protein n=1 Tax=Staphylococcus gallinarum TaxID=1293 RepID=UPI001F540BFD